MDKARLVAAWAGMPCFCKNNGPKLAAEWLLPQDVPREVQALVVRAFRCAQEGRCPRVPPPEYHEDGYTISSVFLWGWRSILQGVKRKGPPIRCAINLTKDGSRALDTTNVRVLIDEIPEENAVVVLYRSDH